MVCCHLLFVAVDANADHLGVLHAVIVGDTNASDIGESVKTDIEAVREKILLPAGAHFSSMNLEKLEGNRATPEQARRVLNGLNIGPNDTLFFYYSGHGDQNSGASPWPVLHFGGSTLPVAEAVELAASKGALKVIAIIDACNGTSPRPLPSPSRMPASAPSATAVERLFAFEWGTVIATSSGKGGLSYSAGDGSGSYFTRSFVDTLVEALPKEDPPGWGDLLQEIRRNTADASRAGDEWQDPFFCLSPALDPSGGNSC